MCPWLEDFHKSKLVLVITEIQPVHPKGNQSWIFIERIDAEAEIPILWPPDAKNWVTWKDPDAGKIEGERRGDRGWDGWMASPTPKACSNSCSSQLCHPTILSSVVPFSSHLQSFQHQGLFKWDSSLHQVAKVLEFQLQHQSFQWTFRTDFL